MAKVLVQEKGSFEEIVIDYEIREEWADYKDGEEPTELLLGDKLRIWEDKDHKLRFEVCKGNKRLVITLEPHEVIEVIDSLVGYLVERMGKIMLRLSDERKRLEERIEYELKQLERPAALGTRNYEVAQRYVKESIMRVGNYFERLYSIEEMLGIIEEATFNLKLPKFLELSRYFLKQGPTALP